MAKILIADDNLEYLTAFREGMELFGHDVIAVPSGADVIPELQKQGADIVFLDVIMEGGGAISVLHAVAEFDPKLPVIVITGRTELLDSPLFKGGLRQAAARISKTVSLPEIEDLVSKLTHK